MYQGRLWIIAVIWTFIFIAGTVTLIFILPGSDKKIVPFKTNISEAVETLKLPITLIASSEEDLESALEHIDRNALLIKDLTKFLVDVMPAASDEAFLYETRAVNVIGSVRSRVKRVPQHVYWFNAFDSTTIIYYEEHYEAPPTSLPHGDSGKFEAITPEGIAFIYGEILFVMLGAVYMLVVFFVGLLGFFYLSKKLSKKA